jgi:predicted transcriptional regulator
MKTTIEVPDNIFERVKTAAAVRRESFSEFVTEALRGHLERQTAPSSSLGGWRSVFGQATREEVESVNALVAEKLERIDPDEWRGAAKLPVP